MGAAIDGTRIQSSPGQDKIFQSDPGSEHNCVGAVPATHGIPCITLGQTDVLNYLVDDLESRVSGKHNVGVIAVSTCQVIIALAAHDHIVVEGPEDPIIAGAAIHKIAGVAIAPAVRPHQVIAGTGLDDRGAAVTAVENVVRRTTRYLFDGECGTVGVVGVIVEAIRRIAIDNRGVAALVLHVKNSAAVRFGEKCSPGIVQILCLLSLRSDCAVGLCEIVDHLREGLAGARFIHHAPALWREGVVVDDQSTFGAADREPEIVAILQLRREIRESHLASQTNLAGVASLFDNCVGPTPKREDVAVLAQPTLQRIVTLPAIEHVVATQPEQGVAVLGSAQNVVLLRPGNRRYLQAIERRPIDNRAVVKLDLLDLRTGKVVVA